MKDLEEILAEYDLQVIHTTEGKNGYPCNVKMALVGFEDFNEVEEVAERFNLQIATFYKKDGWELWQRDGNVTYKPITPTWSNYGDDYECYDGGNVDFYFENYVKNRLPEISDMEELSEFYTEAQRAANEIELANDDEQVVTYEGRYFETIKKECVEWSHDSQTLAIGLISVS